MNIIIFLLLVFFIPDTCSANTEVDSLRLLLESARGKERISLLIKLMDKTDQRNPQAALEYGKEAIELIKKFPDDELKTEIYYRTGWAYTYLNNPDSAKYFAGLTGSTARSAGFRKGEAMELFLKGRIARDESLHENALELLNAAYDKSRSAGDRYLEARILNEKGSVLRRLSRYDEALEYHMQALDLLRGKNDSEELRATYTYLGIISDLKSRHDDALKYHLAALELAIKVSDKRSETASLHNIGILYYKINRFDDALAYYKRALQGWRELNSTRNEAATLNSIGAVYEEKGMDREALEYYKPALKIWEEVGDKSSITIALQNIGAVYSYLGNYIEASDYLERSLAIYTELGNRHGMASSYNKLAWVYDKLGRKDEAVKTAKEGIRLAEEIGNWPTIRHAHQVLGEIYENNGLYKESLAEYKKFLAANDTIFNSEREEIISEMHEKYKSEEQKKQIEMLQREGEIKAIHRTYLIIGIILLLLLLLLIYSRYRLKQRTHDAFHQLHQKEVESSRLKIEAAESKAAVIQAALDLKAKELDAARELQLSMLPDIIPVHSDFTVAAKMITAAEVGGDYYDFYKCKDNSFTIAIGDATGHGARAGIMVSAVKSLFTLLAGEEDIAKILCRSTRSIKEMHFTNLFMALALLRIKGNELEYVGAGMPPAYIRRAATGDVEELTLKGLPLGIGSGTEYRKSFTHLHKGDILFLTSDGFPELFNKDSESLGYNQIPRLLEESAHGTPEEIIKHFTDCAGEWLNGTPQHDDMTFVVVKGLEG